MFAIQPRAMCAHMLGIMADYRRGLAVPPFRREAIERFAMWRKRLSACRACARQLP